MIFVFVLIFSTVTARNNGSHCCLRAHGHCRQLCEQYFRDTDSEINTLLRRLKLESACSTHISLRRCISESESYDRQSGRKHLHKHHLTPLSRVIQDQGWKRCCEQAVAVPCENACHKASNPEDVVRYCRKSDEMELLNCIESIEEKESCCAHATKPDCHRVCTQYAQGVGHFAGNLDIVSDSCSNSVVKCIQKREIPANPRKTSPYIKCCQKTTNTKCREACNAQIKNGNKLSGTSISEKLRSQCGEILADQHEFWNCFLTENKAKSKVYDPPMDLAKLDCCSKAVSDSCRTKCTKLMVDRTMDGAKIRDFEQQCATPKENNMIQCMDEIDHPCKQGCQDLTYCTNFNHKHGDMFRNCDTEVDKKVGLLPVTWRQSGVFKFGNVQMELPISRDESRCPLSLWKNIACTLAIKPCEISAQSTKICRTDCEQVLSACINWKSPRVSSSPQELCDIWAAPAGDDRCVSFNYYDELEDALDPDEVTHPCSSCPCAKKDGKDRMCVVDSDCAASRTCGKAKGRKCLPGCLLGQRSTFMVPDDTEVMIPVPTDQKHGQSCHRICKCNRGYLRDCLPMKCGVRNASCTFENHSYEHGSSFFNYCNLCACYEGQIICTDHKCGNQSSAIVQLSVIDMTAHCECTRTDEDSPVCDRNGVTYRSPCVANCFGVYEFQSGSCESINHCSHDKCSAEKCVVQRQVCLGNLTCPQHICVSPKNCEQHSGEEVCTLENETKLLCEVADEEETSIAYFGPCTAGCKNEGVVCGSDGNTYESECLAFSRMVTVDYEGPCMPFTENDEGERVCDESIECPSVAQPNCSGLIPPGACCPICAGAFQILYSKRKVAKLYDTILSEKPFTIEAILKSLSREVTVAECAVRGYLTNANYIIVMIVSVAKEKTPFQLHACVTEAEKLGCKVLKNACQSASH